MKRIVCWMLLCCVLLGGCGNQVDAEEEAFASAIEALDSGVSFMKVDYAKFYELEDLLSVAQSNLVIRCKITGRDESTVVDPFGRYKVDDLGQLKYAQMYIVTPYTLEVQEVYYGDLHQADDTLTYNAPYGIIGEHTYRGGMHPVLRVGKEYIMFLTVSEIAGNMVYCCSFNPEFIVEVTGKNSYKTISAVDWIFGKYEGNIDKLVDALNVVVEAGGYTPVIEKYE